MIKIKKIRGLAQLLLRNLSVILCLIFVFQLKAAPLNIHNQDVLEAYFDGVVSAQMQSLHSPSGVVAVMKDNEILFAKGYGYSDVAKKIEVDPKTTLFRPGSISKLFTWVSIMQLVEQGKVDLDVDVNLYLKKVQVNDTWPGNPVTLRHILTHTAGFEDAAIGHLIVKDETRIIPLDEALAKFQPSRVNPPGEHVAYSNWATALAGLIVADVSGINFNDYVKEHIFSVLDMDHTTFEEPLPVNLIGLRAKAYTFSQGQYKESGYEYVSNFGPAGSSASTAFDMLKFARALLNGGSYQGQRILKASTVDQMLSEGYTHDPRVRGMGLGFIKYRFGREDLELFGHDGATTSFLSHLGMSHSENLVLFTSFSGKPLPKSLHTAVKGFYDQFFPRQSEQSFISDVNTDNYAGNYSSWRSNFTQIEALFRLISEQKVTALADGETLLISGKRYRAVDDNIFEEVDGYSRVAFQEDEVGNITSFVIDGFGIQQFFKTEALASAYFHLSAIFISAIVFFSVLIRLCYQYSTVKKMTGVTKVATWLSVSSSLFNLLFLMGLMVLSSSDIDDMVFAIPLTLKVMICFALLATVLGIAHAILIVKVWKASALSGVLARIRNTVVGLCGLYMVFFYYYWNLLGFNYFE